MSDFRRQRLIHSSQRSNFTLSQISYPDKFMKKLLTAIAGVTILTMGTIATAPAQAQIFGDDPSHDLEDILNGDVDITDEQFGVLDAVSGELNIDIETLLLEPNQMDNLFEGSSVNADQPPSGPLVFSKEYNGGTCSVDAGCALKAIGLVLSLQCASSGADPQAWAECVQDKNYDKYLAASECTWGACPGFATLPGGNKIYACGNTKSLIAGQSLLNLPTTLRGDQVDTLQISLLSQG